MVALGSLVGTIKDTVDDEKKNKTLFDGGVGVLKIKSFRPFPSEEVLKVLKKAKYVAVVEKAISLGSIGPMALEIKNALQGKTGPFESLRATKIGSFVVG